MGYPEATNVGYDKVDYFLPSQTIASPGKAIEKDLTHVPKVFHPLKASIYLVSWPRNKQ